MSGKVLLSDEDIGRALRRIAHEIAERNRGVSQISLAGIRTRGVPLAQRIAATLDQLEGTNVPSAAIDASLYRDDLHISRSRRTLGGSAFPVTMDISDRTVILVDDVLYTGRTIRAAMDAVMDFGRPRAIQLAILVDRGHRELPIRADYVGKNIPTAHDERVRVHLREIDGEDEVVLLRGE